MAQRKRHKGKWFVITGGPSSGKTTVIHALAHHGFHTLPEFARSVIEREMHDGKSIRAVQHEERKIQKIILQTQLTAEKKLPKNRIVFLDRGAPDSVAYYRLHNIKDSYAVHASKNRPYKKVFLFDLLPYRYDGVRIENAKIAKKIERLIEQAYTELGYDVIRVPVMSVRQRVGFVLTRIK